MKKRLLTLAAGLIATAGVFAVPGPGVNPSENKNFWDDIDYPYPGPYGAWDSIAGNDKYLVSFHPDSVWIVDGLSGLTDFNTPGLAERWSTDGARYSIATTGTELTITFDASATTTSGNFWQQIQFNEASNKNFRILDNLTVASYPKIGTDTTFNDFAFVGYVVDMRKDMKVSGQILIPADYEVKTGIKDANETPHFVLRISLVDVHGNELNGNQDSWALISKDDFGVYTPFELDITYDLDLEDYPALSVMATDRGTNPGCSYGGLAREKYKAFYGEGENLIGEGAASPIPIDFANIRGFRIYLESVNETAAAQTTGPVTIKLKDLVMGNKQFAVPYTPLKQPVSINEYTASKSVEYKIVGNTVYAKGNIVIYNDFGQVVAKGKDKVQVNASGSFNLVTPNGSAKIVK